MSVQPMSRTSPAEARKLLEKEYRSLTRRGIFNFFMSFVFAVFAVVAIVFGGYNLFMFIPTGLYLLLGGLMFWDRRDLAKTDRR